MKEARRIKVYVGERDRRKGRPLYEALVDEARRAGMAGATVFRGMLGFGAGSLVHTAKILRLSEDMPLVVEIVDTPERVQSFLPRLEAMVEQGVITVETVQASFRLPLLVRDVMSSPVVSVEPGAALSRVVDLMLERGIKSLLVQDGPRAVGIVTSGDLVLRAGMGLRLSLQRTLPPDMLQTRFHSLDLPGKTAGDVMSSPVAWVGVRTPLEEAAQAMAKGGYKRLLVKDDNGNVAGMLSRIDVLSAISRAQVMADALPEVAKSLGGTAADVMFREVPTVGPDDSLEKVLGLLVSSKLRRVVVVDKERKVLGIVLDAQLVRRYSGRESRGFLESLLRRLSSSPSPEPGLAGTAKEVMLQDVHGVDQGASVSEVLARMMETGVKRLVVTDSQGRLAGMVDRDALLRLIGAGRK